LFEHVPPGSSLPNFVHCWCSEFFFLIEFRTLCDSSAEFQWFKVGWKSKWESRGSTYTHFSNGGMEVPGRLVIPNDILHMWFFSFFTCHIYYAICYTIGSNFQNIVSDFPKGLDYEWNLLHETLMKIKIFWSCVG
jgi:hypothetical protein